MPRQRQYGSDADRQAAHRARKQDGDMRLLWALYQLNTALWNAGDRGDALALTCRSTSTATMVQRLIQAFDARPDNTDSKPAQPDSEEHTTL